MEYREIAPGMVEVKSIVELTPERSIGIVNELLKKGIKTVIINGQLVNKNTISKLHDERILRQKTSNDEAIHEAVIELFEK